MSQHHYPSRFQGQSVSICTGWDRNTQAFHLAITDAQDELLHMAEEFTTAEQVQHEAQRLGCSMPATVVEGLVHDAALNAGNTVAFYDRGGHQIARENYTRSMAAE